MCDKQHNNGMSLEEQSRQMIDPMEIKHEPDIKEDPDPVDNVIEDAAGLHPLTDYSRFDILDGQTMSKVKITVKEEVQQKNEKASKTNKADNATMDKQNGRHLSKRNSLNTNSIQKRKSSANKAINSTKANAHVKRNKQHKCGQCEYVAKDKYYLKRHLLKHTGEKPWKCDRCAKSFTRKEQLKNHMKYHINEFPFHCSTCLKGFDRKNEKLGHENDCKTLRYECHLCKKSFGSIKRDFTTHMWIHSGEKAFACTECTKQFTTKGNLKMHMKLHAGPRSFRCSKCRQGFALQNEMIAHQKKCSRRVYECYVCGKFIGCHKRNLERHMRIHTGDKPFECTQCPKKFTRKSHLRDHMKIHCRSLPWKCVICRQGFTIQIQWKSHQRNCTRRMYECHLCKQFFGSCWKKLKNHMTKHSGEKRFQCEICGGRFTQKRNLTRHINTIHNKVYGRINRI